MPSTPHVKLYTRPGCHLCAEAKREIFGAGSPVEFTFEEINVDTDAGLVRRFGMDVPVVTINDVVVFKHRLTAREFAHQLRHYLD